ncbi:MAG: hypothetical protein CMM96_05765 [Rickettsiales bacterium]|nr:hypothetical protein [Rickettsiales bacterium]
MFNRQKTPFKTFKNFKILRFLLISPILISIPFFTSNNGAVKAGLEFQWDQDSGFRRLKWFQKQNQRSLRNTIYFFLRPSDRKNGLIKLNLDIPKHFKTTLKTEKINLCKVKIGGFETRTKCITDIPADIEINKDNTSLDIFPYSPIPSSKESYAIVIKANNPKKSGLYQFHSFGQYVGSSVSSYLGSWTIVID